MSEAVKELQQLDSSLTSVEELTAEITLCQAANATFLMRRAGKERPVFVLHLAPVQTMVQLNNDDQDPGTIATAIATLPAMSLLEKGTRFAVQSRLVQMDKKRPYSGGRLNQMLAEAFAEETGAVENIKKPQIVISILCTRQKGYLGISPVEENLSSWSGGARHFAQTPEQISRAEFKLLEALEVFAIELPSKGRALDLGAAPGGWTRLLLDSGLQVVAVDPANLDDRIARRTHLEHHRIYAENYLEEAQRRRITFDLIVNDMRMDARDAARLLTNAARSLRKDGFIISTLKLPHATQKINPLTTLEHALSILSKRYGIIQVHQLFHNRQEVTVAAARPLPDTNVRSF